jgi:hypothetical protein
VTLRDLGNRKSSRRWTRRAADLIIRADQPTLPCMIIDLSDGGARLTVSRPLPGSTRNFTLVLFKDGSVQRDCEIVWTDSRYVGVKFVSEWYAAIRPVRHSNAHERATNIRR